MAKKLESEGKLKEIRMWRKIIEAIYLLNKNSDRVNRSKTKKTGTEHS